MDARPRSTTTLCWAAAVGVFGAFAIAAAGVAFIAMLGVVGTFVGAVTAVGPFDSGPIVRVTVLAAALCLAVAGGAGWVVSASPEGLTPRWLAGLTAGLLGTGVGVVVFSLGLGIGPF